MISAGDFYSVMCAMVPLYFAMFLAYGSVRWWKIFTPDQCAGINRFVAVFAVPVLSFHFIAQNDPYKMDLRFIVADTLSKFFVLSVLCLWALMVSGSSLDWVITLFSVSTLPNTLVMGIPLLKAMYGGFTQSLMVQLVVLQCIIWYTMLLFLFEYRAATVIIRDNFPGELAAAITNIDVDGDVVSLDGRNPLIAESVDTDNIKGHVRVRIRRSISGHNSTAHSVVTSRPSNLSGAEIYSVNTRASSDAYSLQPTPRESNFDEHDVPDTPVWLKTSPASTNDGLKVFRPQYSPSNVVVVWEEEEKGEALKGNKVIGDENDLSFRSTAKFIKDDDDDDDELEDEKKKQKMPGTVVMLRLILTMVGRKLSRNPNTYSSLFGLVWSLISYRFDIRMPILIKNSVKIISDAGLGMAMFSLGLFMALQPRIIACGAKMATISMTIRFICGPIVMSAASIAVGLRGVKLHTAIVQAALPQGIVPFVFAREYGLHPDILSTGVIFGMLVSLPVTLLYYIFLGL